MAQHNAQLDGHRDLVVSASRFSVYVSDAWQRAYCHLRRRYVGQISIRETHEREYQTNTFVQAPPAARQNHADCEAPEGVFSATDNSITVLQRRGAVFMACHNAIWELSGHLIAAGVNPDHLSHEALAAELTNHLIPGIVLTPGVGGTLVELQRAGFTYGK
jgi:hypothetical protein